MHLSGGWKQTPLLHVPKMRFDPNFHVGHVRQLPPFLQRVVRKIGSRPARQVAFWLALVPIVLPAPTLALIISYRAVTNSKASRRFWFATAAIAVTNLILSSFILAEIWTHVGELLLGLLGNPPFWSDPKSALGGNPISV